MLEDVKVEPGGQYGADTIDEDLSCLTCNYNLRGLARYGKCPECGLSIPNTIIARAGTTKRELAAIAIRIAIVWTAFGSINFLSNNFISILFLPLTLGVLVLAWWKTDWIATRAVRNDGLIVFGNKIEARAILSIAFCILGVICLLRGITTLGWAISTLFIDRNYRMFEIGYYLTAAINLFFGVILLLGADLIARALNWLRTAGTNRDH